MERLLRLLRLTLCNPLGIEGGLPDTLSSGRISGLDCQDPVPGFLGQLVIEERVYLYSPGPPVMRDEG